MFRAAWLTFIFLFVAQLVVAQVDPVTTSETYRLKPEDVILIQVYGEQQINREVPVGPDGNINPPFLRSIKAEGKTIAEVEAELVDGYKKQLFIREPRVSVTISRFRQIIATISGRVNRPGVYPIRPGDRVINLLANGQGPLPDADQHRATLRRKGSRELIPIDLYSLTHFGDLTQNYELEDGDEVTVPEQARGNLITVLGSVPRPGPYQFRESMRISDALSNAGYEIQYQSRLSKTVVIREKADASGLVDRIPVNMARFFGGKSNGSENITLRPGDIVYVPPTNTPDDNRISRITSALANTLYILDRFGFELFNR